MDSKDEKLSLNPLSTLNGISVSLLLEVYNIYTQYKEGFPNSQEFYQAGYQQGMKDCQEHVLALMGIEPEETILN